MLVPYNNLPPFLIASGLDALAGKAFGKLKYIPLPIDSVILIEKDVDALEAVTVALLYKLTVKIFYQW